jgi:zinc protease
LRRRLSLGFALTLLLAAAGAVPCAAASVVPRVETLENGVRVVLLEDHSAPLVSAAVWIHVGGKDELEEAAGFSHFLEHLIPQGTAEGPPRQLQLQAFRAGGTSHAEADYDRTFFSVQVPPEGLEGALRGLHLQIARATLTEEAIRRMRPFLQQELRGIYDDPRRVLYLEQMRAVFPEQPYRLPFYGSFEALDRFEHSTAGAFYGNFYVANKLVVAVGGDIQPPRALALIRARFGSLKPSKTLPPKPKFEEKFTGPRRVVKKLALREASVSLLFAAPGYRHPDRAALSILARLLDDRAASPVWRDAVDPARRALAATVRLELMEERGFLGVSLLPSTPSASPATARAALEALATVRREGFPDAEVRRIARQMRLESTIRRDPVAVLTRDLAEALLFGDVRYAWNLESDLEAVTAADVKRVARTYLVSANTVVLLLLPQAEGNLTEEDAALLDAAAAGLGDPAAAPPPPEFALVRYAAGKGAPPAPREMRRSPPKAAKHRLPNGLTLVVKPDRTRGLVAASLQIRAGSALDPPGKEGAALLTASSLWLESRSIPRSEFRRRSLELGSPLGVTANRETVEAGLTVLPGDLPEALRLLAGPVLEPVLSEEEIAAARDRANRLAEVEAASPLERARELFRDKVYHGHPYARPPGGTELSRAALTREDLMAFHARTFRPERAVLTLAGDIEEAPAKRIAAEAFGAWGAGAAEEPPGTPGDATREAESGDFARTVDTAPAAVVVGFPAVGAGHPDFPMVRALGTILGARAFLDLVLDQGLAVSVTAVPEGLGSGGAIYVEAAAPPRDAARVAYELILRARALALKEVGTETVDDLVRIETGRLLREKENLYAMASNLGFYELVGPGFAAYDEGNMLPSPLAPPALREAAARYFDATRLIRATATPVPR